MTKFFTLLLLALIITFGSCEKDSDEMDMDNEMDANCDTSSITYDADIKTLFSGCQGSSCHGSGTGREMTDYVSTKAYAEEGRILGALNRNSGFSAMPKNGSKFSDCSIAKVKAWIDADYPEN